MLSKAEQVSRFARKTKAHGSELLRVGWGAAAVLWILSGSLPLRSSEMLFIIVISLGYLGVVLWLLPVIVLTCLKLPKATKNLWGAATGRRSTSRPVSHPPAVPSSAAPQPISVGAVDQQEILRPRAQPQPPLTTQRRAAVDRTRYNKHLRRGSRFTAFDVLRWWELRWGPLTPELQRRFLQRLEVRRLLRYPPKLVMEAISQHQKLVDILRYVQERGDGLEGSRGPFGSDPYDGGTRVPRRPRHPSGHPGLEKQLPETPDTYRVRKSKPRRIKVPEESQSPSHGWKKTG
jgi:hypothetical protein